jgi:hypothetical protein
MSGASESPATASRGRIVGARVLLVIGVLLTVISILSTYVKREALDPDRFKQTSQELIANPAIQQQVAATLVDAFNNNVDVSAELQSKLPANLQGLAGPLAGISSGLVDQLAGELVTRPRVQDAFVQLSSVAQAKFVDVLHGNTRAVQTTNGNVVLDLRPLVLRLGDRFGFVNNLAAKVPQDSAQITILKSDDLKTAQNVTHWLEQIANYIWILAAACFVGAIWLARGRRRQEVRALGIGFVVVGILVLLSRFLAGTYLVDHLVVSDTVKPAASDAWNIITQALAAAGWVALSFGVLVAVGAWLVGPGDRATAARSAIWPVMERAEVAWGAFVIGMLLLIWILPIQMFRTTAILVVAGAIGFFVLRRQVQRESAETVAVPAGAVDAQPVPDEPEEPSPQA